MLRTRLGPAGAHRNRADFGERGRHQRRQRLVPSGGTHPRLGAGPGRASRGGVGRLGRLQDGARPDVHRRSSRCAATCSSPSRRSGCRSTAGRRRTKRSPRCASGGAEPGQRPGARDLRVRAGEGAAGARRAGRRRHRPDLHARRGRASSTGDYRAAGIALPATRHRGIAAEGDELRGQPDRRAAVGGGEHVAPPLRRHLHGIRVAGG